MKKILLISFSLLLCILTTVIIGYSTSPETESIKIGVPYPMSGCFASDGLCAIQAATLAVDEINESGGLCGRNLEIIGVDTKELAPEDISTAAEILAAKQVDLVVYNYAGEPADIQAFGSKNMVALSWNDSRGAQKAILADPERNWNIYRLPPNGTAYAAAPFKLLTESLPYNYPNKKLALLTMDQEWSRDISADLRKLVQESEWDIVLDITHSPSNTEYGTQLSKIRSENPSIIWFSSLNPIELVSFMKQFRANPTNSIIYAPYTPTLPEFLELLGPEKAEGLIWGDQCSLYGSEKQNDFKAKFKAKFGRDTNDAMCYDQIMLWAEAVKNTGCNPKDYRTIVDYLTSHDYDGVIGTYQISKDTHFGREGYDYIAHRTFQIQDGNHVLIYLHDRPCDAEADYCGKFKLPPWIK